MPYALTKPICVAHVSAGSFFGEMSLRAFFAKQSPRLPDCFTGGEVHHGSQWPFCVARIYARSLFDDNYFAWYVHNTSQVKLTCYCVAPEGKAVE